MLEGWCAGDTERESTLVRWFAFADGITGSAALTDLLVEVLRSGGGGLAELVLARHGLILSRLEKGDPANGAKVLQAAYECWFDENPHGHPFSNTAVSALDAQALGELASKQPYMFILGGAAAPVRSIRVAKARREAGEYDYELERPLRAEPYGCQALLAHYRIALCKIAETEPDLASELPRLFCRHEQLKQGLPGQEASREQIIEEALVEEAHSAARGYEQVLGDSAPFDSA